MEGSNTPETPVNIEANSNQFDFHEVSTIVKKEELPLMQQAAEKTGLKINVTADEGQQYVTRESRTIRLVEEDIDGMRVFTPEPTRLGRDFIPFTGTVAAGENYITISGKLPVGKDYTDFWHEYQKLTAEPKLDQEISPTP